MKDEYCIQLLSRVSKSIAMLPLKLQKKNIPGSWIYEAQENIKTYLEIKKITTKWHQKYKILLEPDITDPKRYQITSTLFELVKVGELLEYFNSLDANDTKRFTEKLMKIFSMPLLPEEENKNTNEGRNLLYELELYYILLKAGYNVNLDVNPDINVTTEIRSYAIECKRIFSYKSYKSNINESIYKLKKHSLDKPGRYGIVAINYSRYFLNDEPRIFARNKEEFNIHYHDLENKFINKTIADFFNIDFPYSIPLLILNFEDWGYINGIAYPYQRFIIQTTDLTHNYEFKIHKSEFELLEKYIGKD